MKNVTTLLIASVICLASVNAQDVRINEVSPEGDWIELYNQSGSAVDVTDWYICGKFVYRGLDNSTFNGPPVTIISGTLLIPAGGYLVVSWDIDAAGSDVGLYNSASNFGDDTLMEDFMQYNFTGGGGRENVAVTKGIWTVATSVPLPAAGKTLSYFGPGTGTGAWDASESTQGANNSALPVELASFEALLMGNAVNLKWTTQSEINNLGFEVQMHSQTDPTFKTVTFVNAGPNGSGIQDYNHVIDGVSPGKHLFRLLQIDIGGAIKYSDTVELLVNVDGLFDLTQAYPNPFVSDAQFSVTVARQQNVQVELIDMSGKVVQTLFSGLMTEGDSHQLTISSDDLSSGTYLYRARGENFAATNRVVLIR